MKNNKSLKIILGIGKVLVTIFLLVMLFVVVVQKVTKNNLSIGGFRIFTVITGSMLPDYKIGDVLVIKEVDAGSILKGDRVTYKGTSGDMMGLIVTHEVVSKRVDANINYFITRGLANDYDDPEINETNIYGKVVYRTLFFSFVSRLMTNIVVYYGLFVVVGVVASYQVISIFFLNKDDKEEEIDEEVGGD